MGIVIGDKERLPHQSLEQLKAMDIKEAGEALKTQMGKPYASASGSRHIEGVFKDTIERPSGKFAVIEKSREFTLVPWRPIMERRRGQSIIGRASGGGGISWDVRGRDRGLSR